MVINMKAYFLSLLLIFVLLDTIPTISSGAISEIIGKDLNALRKLLAGSPKGDDASFNKYRSWITYINFFKNTDEKGIVKTRRPPSNFTKVLEEWLIHKWSESSSINEDRSINKVEIDGLNTLKEYLSRYGYMPRSKSFTNLFDYRTKSAIKTYQKFFNLEATGELDKETVDQMFLLRCGVPDVNYTFHLSATDDVSWPLGTGWFPKHRRELTYGFRPASKIPLKAIKVFRDSFKRWSLAVRVVNFTETTAYDVADIKIGFFDFNSTLMGKEAVGTTVMVKQSYYHKIVNGRRSSSHHHSRDGGVGFAYGIVALDSSRYWALPSVKFTGKALWKYGVVDLETVVMHQIGHLLGLHHSSDKESVMYPSILPEQQRKVHLSKDDKEQIRKVYFSGVP